MEVSYYMIDKKIQVFVSSTFKDLIEERNEIVFGILKSGHIPVGMELFSPVGTQQEVIEKKINESDAYCLIIGSRYGTIDKETGISYTEWEYQYAKKRNLPIFVIALSESYLEERVNNGTLSMHDIEINNLEYKRFKGEVIEERLVATMDHISGIKGEVQSSLQTIVQEHGENLIGWVSGTVVETMKGMEDQYSNLIRKMSGKDIRIKNLEQENAQIKSEGYTVPKDFTDHVRKLAEVKDGNEKTKEAILFLRDILAQAVNEIKNEVTDEFNVLKHNSDGRNYKMATIELKNRMILFKANYDTNEIAVIYSERNGKTVYQEIDKFTIEDNTFISIKSGKELNFLLVNKYMEYLKKGY